MKWSQEKVDAYQAEYEGKMMKWKYGGHSMNELADTFQPDEGPESKLQGKIVKWCHDHGYPIQPNRQSSKAKTMLTPGWPDCVIILPRGKTLFIEVKSEKGRLSDEQKALRLQFLHLGHSWTTIRSFRAFLGLITELVSKP